MGVLGRYILEGNLTAIRKVLDLHDEDAKYFTSPPKGNNKPMHAANVLKKWCFCVYTWFPGPSAHAHAQVVPHL